MVKKWLILRQRFEIVSYPFCLGNIPKHFSNTITNTMFITLVLIIKLLQLMIY